MPAGIVRISGESVATFSTSDAKWVVSSFSLEPLNLGPRAMDMANCFQQYRVVRLKLQALPAFTGANDLIYFVGYSPGTQDLPTGPNEFVQLPSVQVTTRYQPSSLAIPRRVLLRDNLKWWDTQEAQSTQSDSEQGHVYIAAYANVNSFNSQFYLLRVMWTIEFQGALSPDLLPAISALSATHPKAGTFARLMAKKEAKEDVADTWETLPMSTSSRAVVVQATEPNPPPTFVMTPPGLPARSPDKPQLKKTCGCEDPSCPPH
jgi:hypothetical protein